MPDILKAGLRRALIRFAPRTAAAILSARARAFAQRAYAQQGCLALNTKLIGRHGSKVIAGPFRGLELPAISFQEHLGPYLLGTYECELHPVWSRIVSRQFSQILDVGAKFGFYAAGLARQFPTAEVIAFDTDWWARKAARETARLNGTPNVRVEGFCSRGWLEKHLREHAFILSDCEGYEAVLFRDAAIPALRSAALLIELHEQASPGVGQMIADAFNPSHQATRIASTAVRTLPPEVLNLSAGEEALAVAEFRGAEQSWLFLEPLSTPKNR